jgi:hypothetical protein
MIRNVVFLFLIASSTYAIGQVKIDASKDSKKMTAKELTATPTTGQINPAGASLTTIPAGKCCKVNIAYPATTETIASKARTSCINNAIPELTPEECAKNSCKIEIIDDKGKPVIKGWQVVMDKSNIPTIDASKLPKGKYKVRFISGAKKAEKAMDF